MHNSKNILISGAAGRSIGLDILFDDKVGKRPVVIYAHGFNGFKDWGNFDLIAGLFAFEGFVLVKFNFSHNGTTIQHPQDFADLEAFGNNNYTKELEDLSLVTDWVCNAANEYYEIIDADNIYLIGHSMGGGIAIIHASEDKRIKKLVTWASVSECKTPWGNWNEIRMEEWKNIGVQYYINTRTNQQMPLYYQLFEDFEKNKERLDIEQAIKKIEVPILICHGSNDIAVPVEKAFQLKRWQPAAEMFITETDHVFGRKHPWLSIDLPEEMEEVLDKVIAFLK